MRILAISDIHGYLPNLGSVEADVLIVAGDLVPDGFNPTYAAHDEPPKYKAKWLRTHFAEWLNTQNIKYKVVIAGNHDLVLMQNPGIMQDIPCVYLQGDTVEIDGIKFHGSPWTPTFGNWAFMKSDSALTEEWDKIPEDTDVLITHGPPYGYCDTTDPFWGGEHVGSQTLTNKLLYGNYKNLKLHVFGHIHPAYGKISLGDRTFANVTLVNNKYEPVNQPMFFEV